MSLREDYEREVRAMSARAEDLRAMGVSAEEMARTLHAERRAISDRYKALTQEPHRTAVALRTLAVYGDPGGPTLDWLRKRGKSWEEIAAGAIRPGKPVTG